ncbi:MAG: lipoate--protein ligase [Bacteroidota bacterium]|nr:lipoate--protein ligase [Bacteroidota bacterium]
MLIIRRHNTDPYFNLATEEYVLKEIPEDSFMLWRNEPSIIVGKHQNTLAEINVDYVRENHIKVVRRLSGGGAVFHDLGNLNFTFIHHGLHDDLIDFRKYTLPILEVLNGLGIDARFEGRNDLTINGMKFSGNAEHVHKNSVLHHGTLLFSSQMTDLSKALKVNPLKFRDKAVKSIHSRVTNISNHLLNKMDVLEFADKIQNHVLEKYPDARFYDLSKEDHERIQDLVKEKYGTWDWNFGFSPHYNFRKMIRTKKSGTIDLNLDVREGIIQNVRIFGDYFGKYDTEVIQSALVSVPHEESDIREALQDFEISDYFTNLTLDEFIEGMF